VRGDRAQTCPDLLTVAEYLEIGEIPSGYSELMEGRVIVVPSPMADHHYADAEARDQIKPQLPAEWEVLLDIDIDIDIDLGLAGPHEPGYSRRPDLAIVDRSARQRQRAEGGLIRASEVVVVMEVISPGSRRTDLVVKRAEYADAGIPHYRVLDLADPVSLLALHHAGELGYAVTGEFTGTVTLTEPARLTLDLDVLL
jgi:Uma2 family endonuclease